MEVVDPHPWCPANTVGATSAGDDSGARSLPWLECLRHLSQARVGQLVLTWRGLPMVRTVPLVVTLEPRAVLEAATGGLGPHIDGVALRIAPGQGSNLAEVAEGCVVAVHASDLSADAGWEVTVVGLAYTERTPQGPVIVVPIGTASGRQTTIGGVGPAPDTRQQRTPWRRGRVGRRPPYLRPL